MMTTIVQIYIIIVVPNATEWNRGAGSPLDLHVKRISTKGFVQIPHVTIPLLLVIVKVV